MDAGLADRLATSIDPKALGQLRNRNTDPAVGKAIASQFGSFLMQGLLQDSSGDALPMTSGTGGGAVNALFASAMGRYAAQKDQLGLADTIYKSMVAKEKGGDAAAGSDAVAAKTTAPVAATGTAVATHDPAAPTALALTPYWQDHGHRPPGPTIRQFTPARGAPAALRAAAEAKPRTALKSAHQTATTSNTAATVKPATPAALPSPPSGASSGAATTPAPFVWAGISLPAIARIELPPAETPAPLRAPTTATITATAANGSAADGAPAESSTALPWRHHWSRDATEGASPPAPVHGGTATPSAANGGGDAAEFAATMAPALREASARLGVSPRVLIAQAALETGWGHSVVGNNVFGIKAGKSWSGATVTAETHEMEGGHLTAHRGTFRSYANVGDAVDDYVALVSESSRYRAALGAGDDAAAYAHALAAGGYATDRDYAAKLTEVADSPRVQFVAATLEDEAPGRRVSDHG
jgi:flagellar protein FlgJ